MILKSIFLFEEERDSLKLPPEIILTGNKKATIEGMKEIIEYSPDTVKISTGKLFLSFSGDSLSITNLENERLIVSGDIFSLSFSS